MQALLVDPDAAFRGALAADLTDAGIRVEEASTLVEFTQLAASYQPDLVIAELYIDGTLALDILQTLVACPLVVLTQATRADDLRAAARSGVAGYLLKSDPRASIVRLVQSVTPTTVVVSPAVASRAFMMLGERTSRRETPGGHPPTKRELQVLQLAAVGMTNREISEVLGISDNTVKNHMRNILKKWQLRSRTEAVTYAYREQLLDLS